MGQRLERRMSIPLFSTVILLVATVSRDELTREQRLNVACHQLDLEGVVCGWSVPCARGLT
jgi:hypothetical protein